MDYVAQPSQKSPRSLLQHYVPFLPTFVFCSEYANTSTSPVTGGGRRRKKAHGYAEICTLGFVVPSQVLKSPSQWDVFPLPELHCVARCVSNTIRLLFTFNIVHFCCSLFKEAGPLSIICDLTNGLEAKPGPKMACLMLMPLHTHTLHMDYSKDREECVQQLNRRNITKERAAL